MAFESQKPDPSPSADPASAEGDMPPKTNPYPDLDIPEGEKPDLLAYLVALPDVDLPIEAEPPADESETEAPEEKTEEQLRVEALAEHIRSRTQASQVTPFALLRGEDDQVIDTFGLLFKNPDYNDIVHAAGQKDTYYYSSRHMTANYATIAILVEENNIPYTVAHMVRYNCKTYPAPTPLTQFMAHPYYHTAPQLERVRNVLGRDPAYADIKEVVTAGNKVYLYSTQTMSERYAKSLAERAEYNEADG